MRLRLAAFRIASALLLISVAVDMIGVDTFPFLFDHDGAVSGYFGISVIPTTIVIAQNGRIVSSIVGDSPLAQLRQIISKAKQK